MGTLLGGAGLWLGLSAPVLAGLSATVGLALLLIYLTDPLERWRLRHIPGPPALPLLGCMPQMLRLTSPKFLQLCYRKYGPVFKVALGRKWVVVVADAELQRQVGFKLRMHAIIDPDFMRGTTNEVIQSGLFRANGELWRHVRGAWQPAFAPASLAGYLPRMVACADQLAARLEGRARQGLEGKAQQAREEGRLQEGKTAEKKQQAKEEEEGRAAAHLPSSVDMWRELGAMTLQVVGSTAYGVDFHTMAEEEQGGGGGGGGVRGDCYGRQLAVACGDVFRYSSAFHGSKYLRVALLLPELRPLLVPLAHALPDQAFTRLLQARGRLLDACFHLIAGWQQAKEEQQQQPRAKEQTKQQLSDKKVHEDGGGSARKSRNGTSSGISSPNGSSSNSGRGGDGAAAAGGRAAGGGPPAVAPGSFLDLILSARDKATGQALSDVQVAGQVQAFILAGYETTANALSFTLYCISTNPEVESRMLQEINTVLGPDRPPSETDLPLLSYTEAVLQEAMRLFPPAHLTTRAVLAEEPVQVGGFEVPPRTPLFLSIYNAHRDPAVWPRPEEFIPERFLPSSPLHAEVAPRVPTAHAPFGYGSRMCIAWRFALQEAKVALVRLYQRLSFELEPGQVPLVVDAGVTLSPRGGLWVRLVPRN